MTGHRYGRLVCGRAVEIRPNGHVVYECQCDCGNTKLVTSSNLRSDHTQSCGCLMRERIRQANSTHRMSKTKIYKVWRQMIERCTNERAPNYQWYGGRGVEVCERWRLSFENFFEDMGMPPKGQTLERKDVFKGYSPENCCWATWAEQHRNKTRTVLIEFAGQSKTASEWSRELGLSSSVISKRLRKGWGVERALTTPTRKTKCQNSQSQL